MRPPLGMDFGPCGAEELIPARGLRFQSKVRKSFPARSEGKIVIIVEKNNCVTKFLNNYLYKLNYIIVKMTRFSLLLTEALRSSAHRVSGRVARQPNCKRCPPLANQIVLTLMKTACGAALFSGPPRPL